MKLGLQVPSAQPGASAEGILAVAKAAERLGFDGVWMFDHLFTPTDIESKYPYTRDGSYPISEADPFFDPLGVFGVIAGATERISIGTAVLIPAYRHPLVLGKILASIENFAPGRLQLGVGAGWMTEEFEAVGITRERRGARLEEYISALRAIWSGKPVAFDGEFYSWTEAGLLPAPTRAIPLLVGGHADVALKRAARIGDGWAASTVRGQGAGIEALAQRIELLNEFRAEAGRSEEPFEILMPNPLWFSDHANPKMPLTGPADHIAGSIKKLEEAGVTSIDLMVFGPAQMIVETAERFAAEVRPLL